MDLDGRRGLIHVHKHDVRACGGGHTARVRPCRRSGGSTPDARPITNRDPIVEGNEQRVGVSVKKKKSKVKVPGRAM